MKLVFFCLMLPFASFISHANSDQQELNFKFEKFDGLYQSYAFSIAQDHDGFIWVATHDGLNRYDGESFKLYRHKKGQLGAISNSEIRKVFVDSKGKLWVGTSSGLNRYIAEKDTFEVYSFNESDTNSLRDNLIWDIYEDTSGVLFVSTKEGLHKYVPEDNKFSRVYIRGLDNKLKEIKTTFQDSNGNYWLGTYANGLFLANNSLTNAVSLTESNHWQLELPNVKSVFDIKKHDKMYYVATDNGLFTVDEDYRLVKHYTSTNADKSLNILSNEVRSIEVYLNNKILIGTSEGLNSIDLHTGSIKYQQSSTLPRSLTNDWILDIFQDRFNNYWIGSYGGGIIRFNPNSEIFQHFLFDDKNTNIESIIEDNLGQTWWYSETKGLNKILSNGQFQNHALKLDEVVDQMSQGIGSELILITESNKLYFYEPSRGSIEYIPEWKTKSKIKNKSPILTYDGKSWFIDTSNKLSSFDLESKEFQRFEVESKAPVLGIDIEKSGEIWAVTKELAIYKFANKKFRLQEELSAMRDIQSKPNNIIVTPKWIWLSSSEDGIILIDRTDFSWKQFTETDGLPNNSIMALTTDSNGNAWYSTNRNISAINPYTLRNKNFDNDYGIEDNEYFSESGSVLKSSQNILFFGGTRGYISFSPEEAIRQTQTLPTPVLTELLIKNKKIATFDKKNKENSLVRQLEYTKEIVLEHAQSPFGFEFVAPNPKLPSRVHYRYRLEGLEEQWIDTSSQNRRATYTNVSPGFYKFIVEAYDIYDSNQVKSRSIDIRILPPWWLSNSAIFIYSLLILAIIAYFLQQMRHKRLYHLQIKLSEERLKLSLWGSGDEMWDWNIKTGRIYRSNIWGILEFPQDGKRNVGTDQTNIHQQDIPRVRTALNDHFEDKTEHFESTYRVKDKNDQWIWVLDRGKIVERDDKKVPTRMTGTLKDISQIKRAEENLKLFAKCIENISDAVVIYDRQFNVVDVNKAFQRITNKSKKSMIGTALRFSNYPEHFTVAVKKHLITKGSWHGEVESQRENNEKYLTDLNIDIIRDENKHISHFVGVFSDITKRKETEAELRRLASSDTLTGLPNRSYFQANQKRLVDNKIPHALLVFDLDNFKKINDSMGHEVGDALLCKVAQRILTIGRKQDTVYRLGGDEFSLLIENTNDIHTITSIAKEILRTIALPFKLKNQEIVLYSSIGIVLYPEDGTSPEELLKNADTAMYHAKDLGGNNYQFFNDSMNKQAVKRLQIENLIRHGLKEDYFSVFYQPKIEISTGKVAGMEALVRFETPSKGIVSPVVFIPVSEETGQIIDIGEIVLRKACHATKRWVDAGLFDGRIAVNLSAVQFTQPNLVGMIANTLKESGLAPKYLELEITEGTVMDSPQKAIDTMLQIRAMGVHLSLDDFGTGYSSLAYLKKFPLNTLKIDKAFVDDIETSEQGRNMVATIVTIAHNLDLQVVAEGVETNQQLSFLAGLRCEQLQGYLYSKPLPEPDFQKYLLSHQITDRSTSFGKI